MPHFSNPVLASPCSCCLVAKSCPTLCDPMDCSPPACSVHGIFLARILEWVAMSSSRGSSRPFYWTMSLPAPALQVDSSPLSHEGSPSLPLINILSWWQFNFILVQNSNPSSKPTELTMCQFTWYQLVPKAIHPSSSHLLLTLFPQLLGEKSGCSPCFLPLFATFPCHQVHSMN